MFEDIACKLANPDFSNETPSLKYPSKAYLHGPAKEFYAC